MRVNFAVEIFVAPARHASAVPACPPGAAMLRRGELLAGLKRLAQGNRPVPACDAALAAYLGWDWTAGQVRQAMRMLVQDGSVAERRGHGWRVIAIAQGGLRTRSQWLPKPEADAWRRLVQAQVRPAEVRSAEARPAEASPPPARMAA